MNKKNMEKIKNFFNMSLKKKITKFAKKQGYDCAKYIGNWKEYKVYEQKKKNNETSYIGIPLVILVNDKEEIRMSTSDEAMATLYDHSFIESCEENEALDDLQIIIDKFLRKEISVTEIEKNVNLSETKFPIKNSKEYSEVIKPLSKKYYEMFGKDIVFYNDKSYPSFEECFLSLLKAIEYNKEVEYYYNEYLQDKR